MNPDLPPERQIVISKKQRNKDILLFLLFIKCRINVFLNKERTKKSETQKSRKKNKPYNNTCLEDIITHGKMNG